MAIRVLLRVLIGALSPTAVLLCAAPALAAPAEEIPPQVTAFLAGDEILALPGASGSGPAAVRPAHVHQVFSFSVDFLADRATDEPVTARDEWRAVIERDGGSMVATVIVHRPNGGPVELGGYSLDDVDLARALAAVGPDEIFIEDPTLGAYYALRGTTVRPLSHWARTEFPQPGELSALQPILAERIADNARAEARMRARASQLKITALVGGVAVLVIIGGTALVWRRRRHRSPADDQSGSTHQTPTGA